MAVLMALAFEPFVQNSLHYVSRPVDDRSQVSLLGKTVKYNTVGPLMGGSRKCYYTPKSHHFHIASANT